METISNLIKADSFRVASLSSQIEAAGGTLNNNVKYKRIKGSFSSIYTFSTNEGEKRILTKNEYLVGIISEDTTHRIYYNGDSKNYKLYSFKEFDDNDRPVYTTKLLAKSFETMKTALKERFPNRVVWNLSDPMIDLYRDGRPA